MLLNTILCLTSLVALAGAVAFVIQGPDPMMPIVFVSSCCLCFVLGMVAQRAIATWDQRFRRRSDDSESCQGE